MRCELRPGAWPRSTGIAVAVEQCLRQKRSQKETGIFILLAIPAGVVTEVHRSDTSSPEDDGNVEDRSYSQIQDRPVVVKCGANIFGARGAERLHVPQNMVPPFRSR